MAIRIEVPASKSFTQRALVMASLAPGKSVIRNPADCDDTRVLIRALSGLGVPIEWRSDRILVDGGVPLVAPAGGIFLDNNGTAMRFVTGLAPLVKGTLRLDGLPAMRRRPMPGLITALREIGMAVVEEGRPACPPIQLSGLPRAMQRVRLDPTGSSQQLSALLLAATRWPRSLTIELVGPLPSKPYIEMTRATMADFGARSRWQSDSVITVEPGNLNATDYAVEADHSSAAMVMAASWITGKSVTISGLNDESLQGDRIFSTVLEALSAEGPRQLELGHAPDIVPPTVASALFANGRTRIDGVAHLRIKECDRLGVMQRELAKLGAGIEQEEDAMIVTPTTLRGGVQLDPHGDHRMAMIFGLVGLVIPNIVVEDPDCVSKSFSSFWDVLERFR